MFGTSTLLDKLSHKKMLQQTQLSSTMLDHIEDEGEEVKAIYLCSCIEKKNIVAYP